jgi:hypothetical protein
MDFFASRILLSTVATLVTRDMVNSTRMAAMCVGDTCGDGPICIELKDGNPVDDKKLTIGDCSGASWREIGWQWLVS